MKKKTVNAVLLISVVCVLIFSSIACSADAQTSLKTEPGTKAITTMNSEALKVSPWVKKADMPTAGICSTVVLNGKIYTFKIDAQYHIRVEEYDPKLNKWIKKSGISKTNNKGVFALASAAGKIYAAGGYNEGPINLVEEYNPSKDSWSVIKSMPVPVDCCSAVSANGKLYVIGGVDNSNCATGVVQEYNPAENSWTLKESMPTPRSEFGIAEIKGKIYTMGGNWGTGLEVEEYNPVINRWTQKANMNTKCIAFQAAMSNGKIYAVFRGAVQEYDTITDKWASMNNAPDDKVWLNGAASIDGKIYILGGLRGEMEEFPKGELLKTVWQFDPSFDNRLELNLETNHFVFYSTPKDKQILDNLSNVLESNYDRIINLFNVTLSQKFPVKIYPDIKSFHEAIGQPNAPDHIMAAVQSLKDGIQIVCPEYIINGYTLDGIITHEFTHIAVGTIEVARPLWLNEGLGDYIADMCFEGKRKDEVKSQLLYSITNGKIPSLDNLSTSYEFLWANYGYAYPYTIIDFIVSTYGFKKLNMLIRKPNDFEEIFNISKEQFENNWIDFLKKSYGK